MHAILQPRHHGVHFLKITERSLSTWTRKMLAKHVFWWLMFFYTHLLLQLQPSVLWLSIDVKPPTKWIRHEFDVSWVTSPWNVYMAKPDPGWEGYPVWQTGRVADHPTHHVNAIKLKRETIPHLNGLPHLPGVPHLHYGKGLFTVGDIETLSLNAATSGNKTTHTSPFPLCSKLWCLLSSNWYLESGTTLHRGGGGGKDLYSLFWVGKTLERF